MWGNDKAGVQFGDKYLPSNIRIGDLRLFNMGEGTDKIACGLYGFDIYFNHIEVDGGNVGIDIVASDVRGGTILSYTASTGVKIHAGSEHIKIASITIDTPDYKGLQIDSSHDITLNVTVFENDMAISGGTGTIVEAISIGQWSAADHVNHLQMTANVQNTGGTGLALWNIDASRIFLTVSNMKLATGNGHPNTVALFTGENAGATTSVHISPVVSPLVLWTSVSPTPLVLVMYG